jgi:hypothetical protein
MEVKLQIHESPASALLKILSAPTAWRLAGPQYLFEDKGEEKDRFSLRWHFILPCRIF